MEAALHAFLEGVPSVREACVSSVYGLLIARGATARQGHLGNCVVARLIACGAFACDPGSPSTTPRAACAPGETPLVGPQLPIAFAHAGDAIDKLHVSTRAVVVRYDVATIVQANAQPLVVTLRLAADAPVDAALAQLPALLLALGPVREAARG